MFATIETSAVLGFALPFGLTLAAIACATALGRAVSAAMDAIARQPEAAQKIQGAMVIGCAFIEALTIYALVTVFVLQGKIQ